MQPLTNGTVLNNRYQILRFVGEGGMKRVYLASDSRLFNRNCAVAEMIDDFSSATERTAVAQAFEKEADILAHLENQNIPRILDHFSEQNRHYLVMEYVEGQTLEARTLLQVAPGKVVRIKLERAEVARIALEIVKTIKYLHHRNPPVIYRDLKPSNIMLTHDGGVKLVDFGIARLFASKKKTVPFVTQGYSPAEAYKGEYECASDIYSLGAVLYEAMTARDTFVFTPGEFPPLSREPDMNVNPLLLDLIDRSLSRKAEARPDIDEWERLLVAAQISDAPRDSADAAEKHCPSCGKHYDSDAEFCEEHGKKLVADRFARDDEKLTFPSKDEPVRQRYQDANEILRKRPHPSRSIHPGFYGLAAVAAILGGSLLAIKIVPTGEIEPTATATIEVSPPSPAASPLATATIEVSPPSPTASPLAPSPLPPGAQATVSRTVRKSQQPTLTPDEIEASVGDALSRSGYESLDVSVSDDRDATVSGRLESADEATQVAAVVKAVRGVRRVQMNIDIPQGWLGVRVITGTGSAQVTFVQTRSPAMRAGIQDGDQILAMDDVPIHSDVQFAYAMSQESVGNEVHLVLLRGSFQFPVTAKLVKNPNWR